MTSLHCPATPRVHARLMSRIGRIHQEIGAGRYPSARALSVLLERHERTVKRDLQLMRDQLGAPLRYDRVRGGWHYDDPGWTLPLVRLTEGDLLAFFTAERTLQAAGCTPEVTLLRAGLAKLAALLPEHVSVNPSSLGESLTFQQSPHVAVEPATLSTLVRAAGDGRTVSFEYHSQHRNERTHREADVLLVHNFAGDWYAIAYDHLRGEVRDFHAGRITRLRETHKYFQPPDGCNKDAYLRRGFGMMRGGRSTTVAIRFDAYQARWMRERHLFHPDEHREELPGGELRLSFPVGNNGLEAVARFCLTYAGHCRAEHPAALRIIIMERLHQALEAHRG